MISHCFCAYAVMVICILVTCLLFLSLSVHRPCQFMSLCAAARLPNIQVRDWPTWRGAWMSICNSSTRVAAPHVGTMAFLSSGVLPVFASVSPATRERLVKRLSEEVRSFSRVNTAEKITLQSFAKDKAFFSSLQSLC